VSLKVYDITGRLVNTLVQGKVTPGVHSLSWEGKDNIGRKCASGVYFVRLMAADYKASKKMVMIK
jgi:flagellar hook assembly protein FlgD